MLPFRFSRQYEQPTLSSVYEGTLLGNWLQACREKAGVSFSKEQMPNSVLPVEDTTTVFHQKIQETITQ